MAVAKLGAAWGKGREERREEEAEEGVEARLEEETQVAVAMGGVALAMGLAAAAASGANPMGRWVEGWAVAARETVSTETARRGEAVRAAAVVGMTVVVMASLTAGAVMALAAKVSVEAATRVLVGGGVRARVKGVAVMVVGYQVVAG